MSGFYVYLSSDGCEKLFPNNTKSSYTIQLSEPIELDPAFSWNVALAEVIFPATSNTDNNIALAPGTAAGIGPVFIYSDCASNCRVGDSYSRILRIVSPKKSHQTFPDRFYVPVSQRKIDTISILVASRAGSRYPLAAGKEPVVVVLHFQRESSTI